MLSYPLNPAPLSVLLTEIPDDDHAMAYLMQDGNLLVPCSRYGHDTKSCAPVALAVATIMAGESGEPLTYYGLDADMGLVVNDHDDCEYMIREYGPQYGFSPADLLDD